MCVLFGLFSYLIIYQFRDYNPYYLVGFFVLKFLFRADMLAQHRLLKIVKGEKNINVCQKSVNF